MDWELASTNDPSYNGTYYLTILRLGNDYMYSRAYWDGENWLYIKVDGAEVVAFTEKLPKDIVMELLRTNS